MKISALLILLPAFSSLAIAGSPNCGGSSGYAANMAFGLLKNAGLVHDSTTIFSKTSVTSLASEKIGKDLYRQVFRVIYTESSGKKIEVITVNDASHEECSMSGVEVFVVSKRLGSLD